MMRFRSPRLFFVLMVLATLTSCAAPPKAPAAGDSSSTQPGRLTSTKRTVTLVETREPTSLEPSLQPQNREWSALSSGFLAQFKYGTSEPVPYLAEELP